MNVLQQKVKEIFSLPYKERVEPANKLLNGLLSIGYDEKSAKQLLRNHGISHGLLFRLTHHKHLQCLSEIPVQMP
jgi:hypothetical protein